MDDLRKAAEMALEALEDSMYPQKKQFDAIVGLKQALAQPEQEPAPVGMTCKVWTHGCALFDGIDLPNETLLYTAPPSKPWIGLDDKDFQYQVPHDVITMKYAEAILKEKNT